MTIDALVASLPVFEKTLDFDKYNLVSTSYACVGIYFISLLIGEVFILFGFIGAFELAETTLKGIKSWWWKRNKPCLLTIAKFTILTTGIMASFLTQYYLW